MSWNIAVSGTKAEVIAAVEKTQAESGDENLCQFEAMKAFVIGELRRSDPNYNGKPKEFSVSLSGHADNVVPGHRSFGGGLSWQIGAPDKVA